MDRCQKCHHPKELYETYSVPESRRVGKGPSTHIASIDFDKRKKPLYFIAGENDRTIPANLNYSNFKKYEEANTILHQILQSIKRLPNYSF